MNVKSMAPPPAVITKGAAGTAGGSFLAWVAYTLMQLTTGQAVIETRLHAIELRLPAAPLAAHAHRTPAP